MRLAFRCVIRNGIRRFQIADPSNDVATLRRVARTAREQGARELVVGLTYSISPDARPVSLEGARARFGSRRSSGARPSPTSVSSRAATWCCRADQGLKPLRDRR